MSFARVRLLRQGISKAIVLLAILLSASSAFAAPLGITVTLGSRESRVSSVPVTIDGATYIPLDIAGMLCTSYVSSARTVEVTLPSGDVYDVPATQHNGKAYVSVADMAKVADVTAIWDPAKRSMRFVPHITDVDYVNGVLTIRCNYAVRFKSRSFDAMGVYAVDISPAKLEGQTREVHIGEGGVTRARVGQFSDSEVRIAVDLDRAVKLVASVGKKPNEICIPVAPKPAAPKPPAASTSPASAAGKPEVTGLTFQPLDEDRSRLLITTTGKVTTRPFVLKDPDRLVIDMIGTRLGAGAGKETPVTHSVVQAVRAAQFQENPDIVRVVMDLTRPVGFSIMQTDATQVTVNIGTDEARRGIKGATIVVDAGHGGSDTGAPAPDKSALEKDINLAVARRLSDLLQAAGAYAVLTRYTDTAVGLPERPKLATDMNADVFVSLHCNSLGVPNRICGTETYYHSKDIVCRELATRVQKCVIGSVATTDRGPRSDTTIYTSGFSVLRNASVPAILVEMGYLDHWSDRKKLISPEYQQKYAQGVFNGIKAFLEGGAVASSQEVDTSTYQP
jgi:N-acetylmuramoyl-L-alanine amidase